MAQVAQLYQTLRPHLSSKLASLTSKQISLLSALVLHLTSSASSSPQLTLAELASLLQGYRNLPLDTQVDDQAACFFPRHYQYADLDEPLDLI